MWVLRRLLFYMELCEILGNLLLSFLVYLLDYRGILDRQLPHFYEAGQFIDRGIWLYPVVHTAVEVQPA